MNEEEVQQILSQLPDGFDELRSNFVRYNLFRFPGQEFEKILALHPRREDIGELFERFRLSPWLLSAYEDTVDGIQGITVAIRRKAHIDVLLREHNVDRCLHVTSQERVSSLLEHGIHIGAACGVAARCGRWLDAPHYIHVCLNDSDAEWWAGTLFPNSPAVIVPINLRSDPLIRLMNDPGSRHPMTGATTGFIVDAIHVPSHLLIEPQIRTVVVPPPQ